VIAIPGWDPVELDPDFLSGATSAGQRSSTDDWSTLPIFTSIIVPRPRAVE